MKKLFFGNMFLIPVFTLATVDHGITVRHSLGIPSKSKTTTRAVNGKKRLWAVKVTESPIASRSTGEKEEHEERRNALSKVSQDIRKIPLHIPS